MKLPLSDFIIDFDVLTTANDNVLIVASTTQNTASRKEKKNEKRTKRLAAKKYTQKNTTYETHCTYTFNALANKVVTK